MLYGRFSRYIIMVYLIKHRTSNPRFDLILPDVEWLINGFLILIEPVYAHHIICKSAELVEGRVIQ
jgi:hypothetical protein